MKFPDVTIDLPEWLQDALHEEVPVCVSAEARMQFVVTLSRRNIEHGGGPFGAAVFERETGRLLAPGVNLVVTRHCSVAHAEMVAIMVAQQVAGQFDLGAPGLPACELVTSTEPCAMCLGAIPWSGVRSVVCGARHEDAVAAGFDEGEKPAEWVAGLERRGIQVRRDVCRAAATKVLRAYVSRGGRVYNGRGG